MSKRAANEWPSSQQLLHSAIRGRSLDQIGDYSGNRLALQLESAISIKIIVSCDKVASLKKWLSK